MKKLIQSLGLVGMLSVAGCSSPGLEKDVEQSFPEKITDERSTRVKRKQNNSGRVSRLEYEGLTEFIEGDSVVRLCTEWDYLSRKQMLYYYKVSQRFQDIKFGEVIDREVAINIGKNYGLNNYIPKVLFFRNGELAYCIEGSFGDEKDFTEIERAIESVYASAASGKD